MWKFRVGEESFSFFVSSFLFFFLPFLFFFLVVLGFEFRISCGRQALYHLSYSISPFFVIGSLRTICQGWLWTVILLISASWVAWITGIIYWCPVFNLKGSYLVGTCMHKPAAGTITEVCTCYSENTETAKSVPPELGRGQKISMVEGTVASNLLFLAPSPKSHFQVFEIRLIILVVVLGISSPLLLSSPSNPVLESGWKLTSQPGPCSPGSAMWLPSSVHVVRWEMPQGTPIQRTGQSPDFELPRG
jgi:hypothetical protein